MYELWVTNIWSAVSKFHCGMTNEWPTNEDESIVAINCKPSYYSHLFPCFPQELWLADCLVADHLHGHDREQVRRCQGAAPKRFAKKGEIRWVFGVAVADVISTIYICTTIIYIYIHICTTIIYIYYIYTPYIYIHYIYTHLGKSPNIAELEQSQWIIRIYIYIYIILYNIYYIYTSLHITCQLPRWRKCCNTEWK